MKNVLDRTMLAKARVRALYKILNSSPVADETPEEHSTRCWWEAFMEIAEGKEHLTKLKEYYKVEE